MQVIPLMPPGTKVAYADEPDRVGTVIRYDGQHKIDPSCVLVKWGVVGSGNIAPGVTGVLECSSVVERSRLVRVDSKSQEQMT